MTPSVTRGDPRGRQRAADAVPPRHQLAVPDARLNEIGIDVRAKGVVGDDPRRHSRPACSAALAARGHRGYHRRARSDRRRPDARVVAERSALPLRRGRRRAAAIRRRFERRGLQMPDGNRRQAAVPKGAAFLPIRTAPRRACGSNDDGERSSSCSRATARAAADVRVGRGRAALSDGRTGGQLRPARDRRSQAVPESHVDEIAHPIYSHLARRGPVRSRRRFSRHPARSSCTLSARGRRGGDGLRARSGRATLAAALAPAVFSADGRSLEQVVGDGCRPAAGGRGRRVLHGRARRRAADRCCRQFGVVRRRRRGLRRTT